MTALLVKLFVKDRDNVHNLKVRQRYGLVGGFVGVFCNLILFFAKFFAGMLTSSISITADAFNNLSDAGSCVVTVVGFRMAGMPADAQHPFGHGRIEYVSGLIISMAIMLMGFQLGDTAISKIMEPESVSFSWISVSILILSICVKLWMSLFNRKIGTIIDSAAMKANAMDSISDVMATSAVLLGMFICKWSGVNVDGFIGILVAIFIFYTGFQTARDTLNPLLGQAPAPKFVESIKTEVMTYPDIIGIHDLIVHNYGPGRSVVSLHAEVPCDIDILKIHDTIDNIERDLKAKFDCEAVIHMDPVVTDDEVSNELHQTVWEIVKFIDKTLNIHDFRMVEGPTHTNLIFDIVVPHKFRLSDKELCGMVELAVKRIDDTYEVVINVDKAYVCQ